MHHLRPKQRKNVAKAIKGSADPQPSASVMVSRILLISRPAPPFRKDCKSSGRKYDDVFHKMHNNLRKSHK